MPRSAAHGSPALRHLDGASKGASLAAKTPVAAAGCNADPNNLPPSVRPCGMGTGKSDSDSAKSGMCPQAGPDDPFSRATATGAPGALLPPPLNPSCLPRGVEIVAEGRGLPSGVTAAAAAQSSGAADFDGLDPGPVPRGIRARGQSHEYRRSLDLRWSLHESRSLESSPSRSPFLPKGPVAGGYLLNGVLYPAEAPCVPHPRPEGPNNSPALGRKPRPHLLAIPSVKPPDPPAKPFQLTSLWN